MKSISPIRKSKVLQTFGNTEKHLSTGRARKANEIKEYHQKINFFFIEILKILNYFFFISIVFLSISEQISQKSLFFRTFHHKFLQSLLLLDKFSYNILTHTNLSLEKRHGTKNSTWIFAEIYRQFWTRKGCTRLGSYTCNGIHRNFTTGFSGNYAPNL